MKSRRVADLTVEELRQLIRETVQQAMAEVLVEFAAAAELDEQLTRQADLADYLRSSLGEVLPPVDVPAEHKPDD